MENSKPDHLLVGFALNFRVVGTGVVVELNCKVGKGSDSLRILRN